MSSWAGQSYLLCVHAPKLTRGLVAVPVHLCLLKYAFAHSTIDISRMVRTCAQSPSPRAPGRLTQYRSASPKVSNAKLKNVGRLPQDLCRTRMPRAMLLTQRYHLFFVSSLFLSTPLRLQCSVVLRPYLGISNAAE